MLNVNFSTFFQAAPTAVFAFHERPDALEILTPPWERVEILQRPPGLEAGARVELKVGSGLLRVRWVALHTEFERNRLFVDVQERGPFAFWEHRHVFEEEGAGCRMTDSIRFALPLGWLTEKLLGWAVKARLQRMFKYRHEVTRRYVEAVIRGESGNPATLREDSRTS